MARSVDDVDLLALPADGAVLGVDGDSPLTLNGAAVHYAVRRIIGLHTALAEKRVDQRGLAVVYVRDYCNIPYIIVVLYHLSYSNK